MKTLIIFLLAFLISSTEISASTFNEANISESFGKSRSFLIVDYNQHFGLESSESFNCTLSFTGTANIPGVGEVTMTLESVAETCEEAAAGLKEIVLEFQLQVSK